MKRFFAIAIPAAALTFLALASCASAPAEKPAAVPAARDGAEAPVPQKPPERGGLDNPAFDGLPAECRTYLERVARAFRGRNAPFLLAQGEPQYERDVRSMYSNAEYLALLYRVAEYAGAGFGPAAGMPALDLAAVSGIEYLAWNRKGPYVDVEARLLGSFADGKTELPCHLVVVWKLIEPRILGMYP